MGHDRIASAAKQPLWAVTIWDKKFNSVAPGKQKSAIKYHYLLAGDLKEKIVPGGDVKLLTTSETDWWTTEDKVVGLVSEGEIVSIPWGGNPNVQYFKGRFVTADNRIATSSDKGILDNKFLYYFMLSKRNTIGSFYRGAGLKHPEMSKVLDMEIPLPSIEVQRSFARCMDNVAKVIAIRKTQLESLSQLVKSRFVEMFGEVSHNRFPVVRLCDLCLSGGQYGAAEKAIPYDAEKGRYIRITDIDEFGSLNSEQVSPENFVKDYLLNENDILFARTGATVGKTYIHKQGFCSYAGYLIRYVPNTALVDPVFLFQYTKTADYKHWIGQTMKIGTQPNINSKQYNALPVILPPLALQREFAAFVAKVDKLAFAARQRRDVAKQLYRAKIQEFFG